MARKIFKPDLDFYDEAMALEGKRFMKGLKPKITPWLLFKGEHHFNAMCYNSKSEPFPNGSFKKGTIRYTPGHIYLPLSQYLLAFESSEFDAGKEPRRWIRLKYAAVCPLEELTDEEIMWDGFDSRKDMLYQMTTMEGRHYQDLKPKSMVSYFAFDGINPVSGDSGDVYMIAKVLKEHGYWRELRQKDSEGWTGDLADWINSRFRKNSLDLK
ncbi:MAG: hypothetical protein WC852_04180 [Candidatus Nanoarchaeia archaeon]|jgi:hypothetical protein